MEVDEEFEPLFDYSRVQPLNVVTLDGEFHSYYFPFFLIFTFLFFIINGRGVLEGTKFEPCSLSFEVWPSSSSQYTISLNWAKERLHFCFNICYLWASFFLRQTMRRLRPRVLKGGRVPILRCVWPSFSLNYERMWMVRRLESPIFVFWKYD